MINLSNIQSSILKGVLSREPAGTVYHYTTQAGLLGIIKDLEIWATHTQFLNDTREYRRAVDVVTAELEKRLDGASGDGSRILRDMAEGVNGVWGRGDQWINVCVSSFSEERDSLSQWRAYGRSRSGYAIGFNPVHLAEMVSREEFFFAKCLYKETEQTELIQELVEEVFNQNMKNVNSGKKLMSERGEEVPSVNDYIVPDGGNLRYYLHHYAPILKHESFSVEKEWRIISPPLMLSRERIDFRPGTSTLIPYYRVPIAQSDQPLKLDEIVVGPTPHIEQSVGAVKSFLTRNKLGQVPVNRSAVPYRDW